MIDAGVNAVAIRVLEIACPTSPILAAMKAGMAWEEAVDFTAIQRADSDAKPKEYCPACEPAPKAWYHKKCVPDNQLWKPAETIEDKITRLEGGG